MTNQALVPTTPSFTAITKARAASTQYVVPHWGASEILRLCVACANLWPSVQRQERNQLLILTLYDSAMRISEALTLTPNAIIAGNSGGFRLRIVGKGSKFRELALSKSLVLKIRSHAYAYKLDASARLFPFNRHSAYKIIHAATKNAEVEVPEGVGNVHILRHSGALERLRQTGNPQSVQDQLGHSTPAMTLRYMRTLTADAAINIQEEADLLREVQL